MYSCDKYRRYFGSSRDLDYHINCRKTSCRPSTHHCGKCSKDFSSYKSLWNHKQRCQKRKTDQNTFSRSLSTADDPDDTAKELHMRYKKLHYQFLHGKHELLNELTSLLDEMLHQGFISKEDYEIGANNLEECL